MERKKKKTGVGICDSKQLVDQRRGTSCKVEVCTPVNLRSLLADSRLDC